ncbi:MAG: hypothetical protein JSR18_12855 [Proteobacteria bacterium]|nr:hypothetical protein [Pseudomonadota bacterium]
MNDASPPAAEAAANARVDAAHPWLGLASFTEETRGYFHGREEEVAELARRVRRKLLAVLFGQSGLGKTSILRAGLVPKLRPDGYCPVYVRIDYSREAPEPAEQIKQAIFRETQASGQWTQTGVALAGESLWEFLHHRDDVLRDADGRTLIPLLIFDQFEEIFTLAQGDAFGRERAARFVADLADLVENRAPAALEARIDADDEAAEKFDFARADYRILIALREDYLANLEGLKARMPSITQNRMRLARMTGAQALTAVMKPGGRLVSQEVAEAIVRFVAGGSELANAEVEPSLLSLICRELNNARIAQGRSEISADVLAGSRDTILTEFYERALADQPPGVRVAIEDNLLTESGYRESLAEERMLKAFAAAGAAPGTLATLVDRRLLRIEERLDVRRVELTHDVLCGVVMASRDLRLARTAQEEAERKLAAQRERERATRAALVRARKIAAACAVLAVVAIGASIFGYFATRRAHEAEARADSTRKLAEAARGESEKLVVYLLDDFYSELEPVGRLDIVGSLARRALDYYAALPAALRTPETERNQALAQVRYAAVLRTQGKLDEGLPIANEAAATLARLYAAGDTSETVVVGLARAYETQSRLASSREDHAAALDYSQKEVALLAPVAEAPGSSKLVRGAYARALVVLGFEQARSKVPRDAVATLDKARAVARGIDDLTLADIAAATAYAEAAAWQVQAYTSLGDVDHAIEAAHEGVRVAERVLAQQPANLQALRAQALAASPLANALIDASRPREALGFAQQAIDAWKKLVALDPSNVVSWNNLAVGYSIQNSAYSELGRVDAAIAALRAGREMAARAPQGRMPYTMIAFLAGNEAASEAARGRSGATAVPLEVVNRLDGWLSAHTPPGSYDREFYRTAQNYWPVVIAFSYGDSAGTLAKADPVIASVAALHPVDDGDVRSNAFILRFLHRYSAMAALDVGDPARAARAVDAMMPIVRQAPAVTVSDQRAAMSDSAVAAIVLAHAGRRDEARAIAAPVLAFYRDLAPRGESPPLVQFELAVALHAAALSGVGNGSAEAAEARAIVARLPAELRATREVDFWVRRINAAGTPQPARAT